jgi:hypothetical protein
MFAFTLESLVLRGVLVLRDELTVGLRLGFGTKANPQSPVIRNSRRHPAPGWRLPDVQPVDGTVGDYPSGVLPGAGRSRRQPGAPMLPGAARTVRRTALPRPTTGGPTTTVASSCRAIAAQLDAPVGEEILPLAARQSEKHSGEKRYSPDAFAALSVSPCRRKPAGRTPPVSIRETDGL